MDLILWRHAEAQEWPEGDPRMRTDLERALTPRGEKQAARMAQWLDRQLPGSARILVSPARRCEQTALALERRFKTCPELAPGATAAQLLELVQWPLGRSPVLVIGHQPTLGQTIAHLLGFQGGDCALKKGALWWLRSRERDGQRQTIVLTVQSPEML
ncbi:MAG: histidine phosphatase family protein [Pseudomonadota bacterium]|nr:histidine phosphatase family protein [Pseudomonadota bacterium]